MGGWIGEQAIDDFLFEQGLDKECTWKRNENKEYPRTLPVYVRNSIHHPENQLNASVSEFDLQRSTKLLVEIVRKINGR